MWLSTLSKGEHQCLPKGSNKIRYVFRQIAKKIFNQQTYGKERSDELVYRSEFCFIIQSFWYGNQRPTLARCSLDWRVQTYNGTLANNCRKNTIEDGCRLEICLHHLYKMHKTSCFIVHRIVKQMQRKKLHH